MCCWGHGSGDRGLEGGMTAAEVVVVGEGDDGSAIMGPIPSMQDMFYGVFMTVGWSPSSSGSTNDVKLKRD